MKTPEHHGRLVSASAFLVPWLLRFAMAGVHERVTWRWHHSRAQTAIRLPLHSIP